jgi:hypothetical protein
MRIDVAVGVLTVAEPDATVPPWGSAQVGPAAKGTSTVIKPAAVRRSFQVTRE